MSADPSVDPPTSCSLSVSLILSSDVNSCGVTREHPCHKHLYADWSGPCYKLCHAALPLSISPGKLMLKSQASQVKLRPLVHDPLVFANKGRSHMIIFPN